ncbi:MAG: hypothetical protein AAF439_05585 [Pseudomonadota bacterium]
MMAPRILKSIAVIGVAAVALAACKPVHTSGGTYETGTYPVYDNQVGVYRTSDGRIFRTAAERDAYLRRKARRLGTDYDNARARERARERREAERREADRRERARIQREIDREERRLRELEARRAEEERIARERERRADRRYELSEREARRRSREEARRRAEREDAAYRERLRQRSAQSERLERVRDREAQLRYYREVGHINGQQIIWRDGMPFVLTEDGHFRAL